MTLLGIGLSARETYNVSHSIQDRYFLAYYSIIASLARALGNCRTHPPADGNVLKIFDRICPTIGRESVYLTYTVKILKVLFSSTEISRN